MENTQSKQILLHLFSHNTMHSFMKREILGQGLARE